jgi:WD40 repeat protein
MGNVYVLDAESLEIMDVLQGHAGVVWELSFSPDGTMLATASIDDTLRVWDLSLGSAHMVGRGHGGDVNEVTWSPSGDSIVTASNDGTLRRWDPTATWENDQLVSNRSNLRSIAFHPSGEVIATGGPAPGILLWDARSGDVIDRLSWDLEHAVQCGFDPRGKRLVASSTGNKVYVWNFAERTLERVLEASPGYWTYKLDFHPDGRLVAVGSDDGSVWVWDLDTGALTARLEHGPRIGDVAFAPDGSRLLIGLAGGGNIVAHETATWREIGRIQGAHGARTESIAFHPDGHLFVSSGYDSTARVWDTQTLEPVASLVGHSDFPQSVAFHPDGSRIATGGRDGSIKLWDVESFSEVATLGGGGEWVHGLTFSPDGTILCSGEKFVATLWETSRPRRNLQARLAAERDVEGIVAELFTQLTLAPEVVAAIEERADLSALERRAAKSLARQTADGPRALRTRAWRIARDAGLAEPGPPAGAYERALTKVDISLELAPGEPEGLDVRGVVLFRLGRVEEALDSLLRSDSIRRAEGTQMTGLPAAYLALSYAALGMGENAARYAAYAEAWPGYGAPWWDHLLAEVRAAREAGD